MPLRVSAGAPRYVGWLLLLLLLLLLVLLRLLCCDALPACRVRSCRLRVAPIVWLHCCLARVLLTRCSSVDRLLPLHHPVSGVTWWVVAPHSTLSAIHEFCNEFAQVCDQIQLVYSVRSHRLHPRRPQLASLQQLPRHRPPSMHPS